MGAMKTIHYWKTMGYPLSQEIRVFAGDIPPPPSKEERAAIRAARREELAALKEAEEERIAEREAIQWVERQVELRHAREALQPPPIPTDNAPVSQGTLF